MYRMELMRAWMTTAVTDLSTQKNVSVLHSARRCQRTSHLTRSALGWDAIGTKQHLLAYCSENLRIISKLFVCFFSVPAAATEVLRDRAAGKAPRIEMEVGVGGDESNWFTLQKEVLP